MKIAATILNSIEDWRNKRQAKLNKNKFFAIYLDSVGKTYFSDPENMGDFKRNKEIHRRVWNRNVKPKDFRKYF